MNKIAYLLVVMLVVFHLSTVADASLASTWEEAKSKVANMAHDAGKVAAKAVEAVKNLFTGSNDKKPAPVTPEPESHVTTKIVTSPAESTFVKTSARNSESSGRSSYSHPYDSGSNTYGSTSDQGSAGFGQWSSSGRSAYGSITHDPTTARTYGYGEPGTHGSTSDQGSASFDEWSSFGRSAYESTTARTSSYGRRNGASTYGRYSDDWTSGSGYNRGNNYNGYSSYSKGSPYSDTYYFSEDELSSVG